MKGQPFPREPLLTRTRAERGPTSWTLSRRRSDPGRHFGMALERHAFGDRVALVSPSEGPSVTARRLARETLRVVRMPRAVAVGTPAILQDGNEEDEEGDNAGPSQSPFGVLLSHHSFRPFGPALHHPAALERGRSALRFGSIGCGVEAPARPPLCDPIKSPRTSRAPQRFSSRRGRRGGMAVIHVPGPLKRKTGRRPGAGGRRPMPRPSPD